MEELKFPSSDKRRRLSTVIHANVYINLVIVAQFEERQICDIIDEALIDYLHEKMGIPDPTQSPTLSWMPKLPKATKA